MLLGGSREDLQLGKAEFLAALASGADSIDLGLWLCRGAQFLALIAGLTLITGYVICLAVPDRFGTRGIVKALIVLGSVNILLGLVFRMLPYFGAMDYTIIPVAAPEVAFNNANIDRIVPISLLLSSLPFLDYFLAFLILLSLFAEPILFCVFLRAVAKSMKDEDLDIQTQGLVRLGLGTSFIFLFFLMTSMAGTSEVLLWALRAVYILGCCFYIGQLAYYAVVFQGIPAKIEKQIDPEEIGLEEPTFDDDEDEEDEDEDEEEEERPRAKAKPKAKAKKRASDEDDDD
jgi:hypothetical protein